MIYRKMLTKTDIGILKVFCGNITKKFTIKGVAGLLEKPYPLVHSSFHKLLGSKYLIRDEHNLVSLNYKSHFSTFAYIESLRAAEFLTKYKQIHLFFLDLLGNINLSYFTLLIFGSYAKGKPTKMSDVDVLLIIEDSNKVSRIEKQADNLADNFSLAFNCYVITPESVFEMAKNREEKNVFNETLDSHYILFGAENYYRMVCNAR
ncbi:MAG: nucleotidyltransferase domain-containing protein [Nanoarchaeota archaeon]